MLIRGERLLFSFSAQLYRPPAAPWAMLQSHPDVVKPVHRIFEGATVGLFLPAAGTWHHRHREGIWIWIGPQHTCIVPPAVARLPVTPHRPPTPPRSRLLSRPVKRFYSTVPEHSNSPIAWPILATADELGGLPRVYVWLNECDPLRDEGLAFYRNCRNAGVPAQCKIIAGSIHGAEVG